jgi:hypothetical protein
MWHQVGFGDTRLDSNGTVLRLWHDKVLQNPRFLSSWTRVRDDTPFSSDAVMPLSSFQPQFSFRDDGHGAPLLSKAQVLPVSLMLVLAFVVTFKTVTWFSTSLGVHRRSSPVNDQDVSERDGHDRDGVVADRERSCTAYGAIQCSYS